MPLLKYLAGFSTVSVSSDWLPDLLVGTHADGALSEWRRSCNGLWGRNPRVSLRCGTPIGCSSLAKLPWVGYFPFQFFLLGLSRLWPVYFPDPLVPLFQPNLALDPHLGTTISLMYTKQIAS